MSAIGQESIAERARRLLEPVLERDGLELVDVEWLRAAGRWTLRVYMDKPGGVTVDDCQAESRILETILDAEDLIEPAYDLEVSSPGLERPLRKKEDFVRFAGRPAHLKAYAPLADTAPGQPPRKQFSGELRGFSDGAVEISIDGILHRVPLDRIAKAHLLFDAVADLRRKD